MCGRFALISSPQEVAEIFEMENVEAFPPRYNIAPTQPILMISSGLSGDKNDHLVRWGFVPSWVKEPGDFTLLLNARSETAAEKPSFRNAMRHRRTLIPASGFYEWHRPSDKKAPKQAYWIKPKGGGLFCFGGLMETWASDNGSEIDSGCILTTEANQTISKIHHRMPVVIHPKDFDRWLNCSQIEPRDVADLMLPVSDDFFEAIAVSDLVNKVANMGPELIQPIEPGIGHNNPPETLEKPNKLEKPAKKLARKTGGNDQFDLF